MFSTENIRAEQLAHVTQFISGQKVSQRRIFNIFIHVQIVQIRPHFSEQTWFERDIISSNYYLKAMLSIKFFNALYSVKFEITSLHFIVCTDVGKARFTCVQIDWGIITFNTEVKGR
jgi:hypothetical protein